MLKTTKQITLTGNAMINEQNVMQLTATIPSDTGVGSINQYVQNAALYEANKAQIRRDIAEFTALVYEVEDEMAAEASVTE
ncbi:hypothetical protein LHA31_10370 [Carnobacterium viridans]|uniref:Prophage protein n=1 Tax=Carnobacterium viridans TaxID=174587 RepID=A0A1H0YTR2_9LACT|nr:hypothetical protein [Carnobacterium viridans]UDE94949.1 hypothetical protein LHA31_10370 [Carnobacterium viridans]SDQ18565.1 hypothetical protein SAMN04487752_1151 [Carnobacterium viridans]